MERSDYLSERSERTIYSIMSNRVRARRFQLTINEVEKYEELKSYLKSFNSFRYIISCKETAPETGHVPQGYTVTYSTLNEHPEWFMAVKFLDNPQVDDPNTANTAYLQKPFTISTRLARKLQTGDSV